VNAGASEVAKTFLSKEKITADEEIIRVKLKEVKENENNGIIAQNEARMKSLEFEHELLQTQHNVEKLKITLLNFLECAKLLLLKSRNIFYNERIAALIQQYAARTDTPLQMDKSRVIEAAIAATNLGIANSTSATAELFQMTYPSIMGLYNTIGSGNLERSQRTSSASVNLNGVSGSVNALPPMPPTTSTALSRKNTAGDGLATVGVAGGAGGATGAGGNATVAGAGASGAAAGGGNTNAALTAQEINNIKWQSEMEKGFDNLVETIYPFISDLREAELFNVPLRK
jgi:hypothetical protein